ncbi:MAG: CehA/McbA family metallohydrolase [Myxococcales bacterium]|nr:CehA/McbA family metallohydrolase [Myxococcales bacterium]
MIRPRQLARVSLLACLPCLLALGCDNDASLAFADDPPGQWFHGDFHVHATGASNDTGGESFPEDIKETAISRGLDFIVLTDHSNSTGSDPDTLDEDPALFNMGPEFPYWDRAAELSDESFLMIDGNEISPRAVGDKVPTGHIGCIPENLETFDRSSPIVDRPRGSVTGGEALADALDRGCFTVINHPYSLPHVSYDWTSYDYDALEVWNGTPPGFVVTDFWGYDAWMCDLLAGRTVAAVGGSDNHRIHIEPPGEGLTNPALGYPTTAVYAEEFTWASIMKGLRRGHTAIFEGQSRIALDAYDAQGKHAEGDRVRWIRIRATVDPLAEAPHVVLNRATTCVDNRPDKVNDVSYETLLDQVLEPGETVDLKVAIQGEPGVYAAELATNIHYGALSRALVIP